MKAFLISLCLILCFAFASWLIISLNSLVTLIIPPLANYPIASFAIVFYLIFAICLIAGKWIERVAVEYPYDDRM